ncbi:MAG: flippase [Anaerolineae bacterium]
MRRFASNYAFALLANLAQRMSTVVLGVWVSRRLGVDALGVFFLAASFTLIAGRLSYWGLDQLLSREVAKAPERAAQFLGNFIAIRATMAVLTVGLLSLVVDWLGYAPATASVILLLALTIVPDNVASICQAMYIAREEMGYLAFSSGVYGLGNVVAGGLALESGWGLEGLAVSLLAVSLLTLCINLGLVWWRYTRPLRSIDLAFCRQQLRIAFPFIFVSIFYILDNRADVVLLSRLGTERQVGFYGSANTLVGALTLLPFAYGTSILPVMSRLYVEAPAVLERLYARSFKYLFLLGLPIAVGITLIAQPLLQLIFGSGFEPAGPILQVVIWSVALLFLNVLNSRIMVVADRQDVIARFLAGTLVTNLVLNVALIPSLGAVGSAIARVVSTSLLFVLSFMFVRRELISFNASSYLPRPIVASVVMAGTVLAVWSLPLPIVIPLGGAVYLLTLAALGTFSQEDLTALREMIRPSAPQMSKPAN